MTETPKEQDAVWVKGFEIDGEEQVRAQLAAGNIYGDYVRRSAVRWLARKGKERAAHDQERLERNEASSAVQMALARESNAIALAAKTIAQHARALAIATLIVAMIGSAAAIAGLLMH